MSLPHGGHITSEHRSRCPGIAIAPLHSLGSLAVDASKSGLRPAPALSVIWSATGPANLRLGLGRSFSAVSEAATQCLDQAGLGRRNLARVVACLALAGASEPAHLAAACAHKHPFCKTLITTDAHAACIGAHGNRDGAIIVAGTGTIGWAVLKGQSYRVGWLGPAYFRRRKRCLARLRGVAPGPVGVRRPHRLDAAVACVVCPLRRRPARHRALDADGDAARLRTIRTARFRSCRARRSGRRRIDGPCRGRVGSRRGSGFE